MNRPSDKEQQLRNLIATHGAAIFAFIRHIVDHDADAEELAQDTFLRAFSAWERYDPQRATERTWLCRIAYHAALNHLRVNRPATVALDDRLADYDISEEELDDGLSTGSQRRINLLNRAIGQLPPGEQALLNMHYFEDRPLSEIAYIMDSEPGPLANRLYRIRKKLYRMIQQLDNS
ncbi:MAG: sigma-70 family RNA polymerase sigma factor [Prevotella sp.]|nr:sigma-70 family RNA polymerase sigma factor [Prevotella sp.]